MHWFGHYQILAPLAEGGMGHLDLAFDTRRNLLVVLKRLLPERRDKSLYVKMFLREGEVVQYLHHPHIVKVFDYGILEQEAYIGLEFVAGKSLRKLLLAAEQRDGALPPPYVAQIFSEVCAALDYIHHASDRQGRALHMIHRDINPNNILVGFSGRSKVVDFGISKSVLQQEQTSSHTVRGTAMYMSPEQITKHQVDFRSDIFSLGVCLYEALCQTNPFLDSTTMRTLHNIRHKPHPPLKKTAVISCFAPIVERCLQKAPQLRYESAAQMQQELVALRQRLFRDSHIPLLSEYVKKIFEQDIAALKKLMNNFNLKFELLTP